MNAIDYESLLFRDIILGRSKPPGTTPANLYAVPAGGSAHILGIMVCNTSTADSFRISISPAGAATAPQDFIYFDLPIIANDTFLAEIDTTLRVADTVRVQSTNGFLVFTLFGITA